MKVNTRDGIERNVVVERDGDVVLERIKVGHVKRVERVETKKVMTSDIGDVEDELTTVRYHSINKTGEFVTSYKRKKDAVMRLVEDHLQEMGELEREYDEKMNNLYDDIREFYFRLLKEPKLDFVNEETRSEVRVNAHAEKPNLCLDLVIDNGDKTGWSWSSPIVRIRFGHACMKDVTMLITTGTHPRTIDELDNYLEMNSRALALARAMEQLLANFCEPL